MGPIACTFFTFLCIFSKLISDPIINQDQLGTSLGHLLYLQVAAPKLLFASFGGKNENVIVRKVTVWEYQYRAPKK